MNAVGPLLAAVPAQRASITPEASGVLAGPTPADWAAAVTAVRDLPPDGQALLICHVNPDGDALGTMLGFGLGLRRLGVRNLQATFPGAVGDRPGGGPGSFGIPEVPEPFRALPGIDLLVPADQAAIDPDLVVCFDVAAESRLGDLVDRLDHAPASVVLDHHASNTWFGQINLVDATAAATSVVAVQLLDRLGVPLDAEMAECLYVALATDTGSFKFDMTTPAVHELAARLLATGIAPGEISRRVFDTRPFGAVKLYGEVLGRAELEQAAAGGVGLVWTYATLEDLRRHDQRPYVLEGLIDSVRCAAEADVSCVVKQVAAGPAGGPDARPDGEWAVSLRSKGAVDVSRVAVALGGGGHRLAAGFTGRGTVDDVMAQIRAELDA